MDNRDKQIDEMAKIMCNCYDSGNCKMHGKLCDLKCISGFNALGLYNAGYRKIYDVAEEIFAEIEKIKKRLRKRQNECDKEAKKAGWYLEVRKEYEGESEGIEFCLKELAELKKKYTEEGK